MKVTCEVCGSDNLVKDGDYFVCQGCGCKYSVEDIRSKIGASPASSGNAGENNEKKQTYLELAEKEYKVGNYKTSYEYYEKVIEIDPKCYIAWYHKGTILLKGNNISNDMIKEAFSALANSLEFCPDEEKKGMERKIISYLEEFQEDYIDRPLKKYGNTLSDTDSEAVYKAFQMFLAVNGPYVKERLRIEANSDEFYMSAWENIADTLRKIFTDQIQKPALNLGTYDGARGDFIQNVFTGYTLLTGSYRMYLEDKKFRNPDEYNKRRIALLEEGIAQNEFIIENGGWIADFCKKLRSVMVDPLKELSQSLKNRERVKELEEQQRQEKIRQEKIAKYWELHKDEKIQLESELDLQLKEKGRVEGELAKAGESLQNISSLKNLNNLNDEISQKTVAVSQLGFFKKKEKQALNDEIERLKSELPQLQKNVSDDQARINQIIDGLKTELANLNSRITDLRNKINNPL